MYVLDPILLENRKTHKIVLFLRIKIHFIPGFTQCMIQTTRKRKVIERRAALELQVGSISAPLSLPQLIRRIAHM